MKWLALFIIVLALSVVLGQQALEEPGYVLIAFGEWSIETTLSLLLVALLVLFVVIHYSLKTLAGVVHVPGRLRGWRSKRRSLKAYKNLNRGLVALSEGRWEPAEKQLLRHAGAELTPLPNYLGAAKAAQAQGAFDRRDQYLKLAHETNPEADVAIGLTQAELLLEQYRLEQALASLLHLRQLSPKHKQVLNLLARVYIELKDWKQLEQLLPDLRKYNIFSMERLVTISRECYSGLLDFATQGGGEAIQRIWQRMPKDLRADSDFIYRYALLLNEKANIDTAEELLREHINKHWDHRLVDLYGIVISSNPARQLQYAERWLKEHETDATLLLTLGRLCSKNSLWGKARDYLEVAVSIDHNRVDIYKELGSLYEKTGENEEAMNCYRKGMLLTKSGEIAPPAISTAQVVQ